MSFFTSIQRFGLIMIIGLTSFTMLAQKQVCFTIDDLPVVGYGKNSVKDWTSLTQKLLQALKENDIPAIGYVNENKLYTKGQPDKERIALLEMWLDQGFDLGNHTYAHTDYHKAGYEAFTADVILGEKLLRPMMESRGLELMYFRHPFLRAGNTKESSDSLQAFLTEKDYIPALVTLDSDDYLFAQAYAAAERQDDQSLKQKIGKAYIDHTEKKLLYYEGLTRAVFGRQIAQTYLMHANQLNADYLDELAEMFRNNGYDFVSQSEVLKDEAYGEPVTKFGNWGMSWLYRWALSREKGIDLFKEDIQVPAFISK